MGYVNLKLSLSFIVFISIKIDEGILQKQDNYQTIKFLIGIFDVN